MDDLCTPWDPIPAAANHYTALRVVQLTYRMHHDPLSLIVLSPFTLPNLGYRDVAWRIAFDRPVRGFRNKPLGYWTGGTKPPWPSDLWKDKYGPNGPAMWAVTESPFFDECVPPGELREGWHHYVIADFDESYEIVACTWQTEQLAATWKELRTAEP